MAMSPRLLRPLASGFNPRSIAGLEAWWDASDTANVTVDGGRVAALLDKSGKGRHAENNISGSTQPDYITAALNGRNAARFVKASSQRLTVASSTAAFNFLHNGTPSYVAFVASAGASADPNDVFSYFGNFSGSTANVGIAVQYDDRSAFTVNDSLSVFVTRGVAGSSVVQTFQRSGYQNLITPNVANLLELALDVGNVVGSERLDARINGGASAKDNAVTNAASTADAAANFQIGACGNNSVPLTGDICEMLFYSQQPSASQRSAIRRYFSSKWGVTLP